MSPVSSSANGNKLLLIVGILFIAATLRVTFTGIAPLLDAIRAEYQLTTAQTGLLTTLPLLAFGLVSPLAAGVARRFSIERSLLLAMVIICLGIGLRSLPSAAWLYIGTALIGCGIALGNVLLPGLIKRDFSGHVARMTGAYSITMGAAAAAGSAMVVPLALAGFGSITLAAAGAPPGYHADDRIGCRAQSGDLAFSAGVAGHAVPWD